MSLDPFEHRHSIPSDGVLMPRLKAGQRLFRHYELVHTLGTGGMGVVWLAVDHRLGIQRALKFLPTILAHNEREMRRLRQEVTTGMGLKHPSIVATHGLEVGEHEEAGIAAIVMEHVQGRTLAEMLEEHPRGFLEPDEIAAWVGHLAAALDYLHSHAGRVHRDLKPANILINAQGCAQLIDFGISRRVQESMTRHSKTRDPARPGPQVDDDGDTSATLAYASPQQLAGMPTLPADDIYSLGALLYELLTGTPPFFRGSAEEVRGQIKHERVLPLMQRRAELVQEGANASTGSPIPAHAERTVLACLEKQREKRPASAGEVHRRFTGQQQTVTPRSPIGAMAAVLCLAGAAWAFLSGPKEIIKEVPKLVEDTAAKEEAARQKQRADELEKKHQEEAQKRLAAEAEAKKAREDAAKAALPPPVVPKAVPIGTPATATKSIPFENSLGMKFVPVLIGAGDSQGKRVLFSIWETRSRDYAAFVKDSRHDAGEDWKTYLWDKVPVGRGEGEDAEESSHPVANVSHDDAVAFCAWLTKRDRASGLIGPQDEYRLPTDTEWSYAVGIGDKEDASASPKEKREAGETKLAGIYPWGGTWPPPRGSGNYADEDAKAKGVNTFGIIEGYRDDYATTAPVGSFQANSLGLHDLGGNLWEWTSSEYEPGSTPRVLRGASWFTDVASFSLSSGRVSDDAGDRVSDFGFRCVLVVGGR